MSYVLFVGVETAVKGKGEYARKGVMVALMDKALVFLERMVPRYSKNKNTQYTRTNYLI